MRLLDFLPVREEQATPNQSAVSSATCDCAKPSMTPEQQKERAESEAKETIEGLKTSIVRAHYLWDMRCWERFHDPEEIRAWIRNKCQPNNSGHAVYCIRELMEKHNFSEDQIVGLVMQNNNVQFAGRLVKCFRNGSNCPVFREKGNYSDCNCSERCGGKA